MEQENRLKTGCYLSTLVSCLLLTGCGGNEKKATTEQLVVDMSQRIEAITAKDKRGKIIPRFNQPKTIACVNARFKVHDNIPADLKHGLFAQSSEYPAQIRFANASERDDSKKDIRGFSIKLSNIEGQSLWGNDGTQDFIFNSYPALFVSTPEQFLSFIRARQEDKKMRFFLNPFDPHLKSLWIVYKARDKHNSPLDVRYWSTVPFKLGDNAVKYSVKPCSKISTDKPVSPGENQLRSGLKAHLKQQPGCFEFAIQKQLDPQSMPIEDASVIWDEKRSPFQTVATVTIDNQPFDNVQALAQCERMSFNPWQSLAEHKPLGRMNEVRRAVYNNAQKFRNKENP